MTRPHDGAMLELAALRAIDALEQDEAAAIDAHMTGCAECRDEFLRARAAGAALAFATATPAPPALRARVLHSAVTVRRIKPAYQQRAFQFSAAAAAAAVLVAAGSWLWSHRSVETYAAHCTSPDVGCSGTIAVSGNSMHLEAHGMPGLQPGTVYQAWVIHGKQPPIPEPTFVTTSQGDAALDIPAGASKGDIVAVTVEPTGGSKAPTSKPVLMGTID